MNINNVSLKVLRKMSQNNDDLADYVQEHDHYKNKPQRGGKRFVDDVSHGGRDDRVNYYQEA